MIHSKEHPRLISFRMDWLDLLAVQRTLKSLLQHHSSKASFLQHSAFFTVQFSHPYMTIGKTVALTRWTFVGKVMSLLLNMRSRLFITFLPRNKQTHGCTHHICIHHPTHTFSPYTPWPLHIHPVTTQHLPPLPPTQYLHPPLPWATHTVLHTWLVLSDHQWPIYEKDGIFFF